MLIRSGEIKHTTKVERKKTLKFNNEKINKMEKHELIK